MSVVNDLRRLGPASEGLGWLDCESLETEVATLIPQHTWSSVSGHSRLNANGSPLEICISVENNKLRGRLLVDPCHLLCAEARFHGAWQVAFDLAKRRASAFTPLLQVSHDLMIRWCLPSDFNNGPLWLATVPGAQGMAVYFDSQPLKLNAGQHISDWLQAVAPSASRYFNQLLKPNAGVQFASFGIEGRTLADARVKLYFRLEPATTLKSLGAKELISEPMLAWLAKVIPEGEIAPSGLVISMSAPLQGDGETDAKIDVCGHCVKHTLPQWDEIFAATTSASGLPSLANNVSADKVDVAFAGLGVSANMAARVNVYLTAVR